MLDVRVRLAHELAYGLIVELIATCPVVPVRPVSPPPRPETGAVAEIV